MKRLISLVRAYLVRTCDLAKRATLSFIEDEALSRGAAMLLSSAAAAGPKEEALLVLEKWSKAFSDSDVDGIVKLYSSDTLFMSTGSKSVATKSDEIRKYFENALLNNRPRGASLVSYEAMILSDTAVLITGLDAVTGVRDWDAIQQ